VFANDKKILRDLAARTAEIASLPVQGQKRNLWRKLNGLKPERPMVTVDQVCWNEVNIEDALTLRCEDKMLREWEDMLRKQLYQWKYFPVDSVVENFIRIPKAIGNVWVQIPSHVHRRKGDETGDVYSQAYDNQINSMEDVEKIKAPTVTHDERESARRQALAEEIFDGLLPVRMEGFDGTVEVWDKISVMMSVEGACFALADQPEMMHALATRLVEAEMSIYDQLEKMDLLCGPQSLIHCTGAWTPPFPRLCSKNLK
jgi:hypothetical protein